MGQHKLKYGNDFVSNTQNGPDIVNMFFYHFGNDFVQNWEFPCMISSYWLPFPLLSKPLKTFYFVIKLIILPQYIFFQN